MLVLTRKQCEKIRIGDSITITVLRMKGKAVRLGIEAPKEINVLRGELVFDSTDDQSAKPDRSPGERHEQSIRSASHRQNDANAWPTADVTKGDRSSATLHRLP